MTNQRKTERVKAMTFTAVYEQKGRVLLGFLGDLTLQGAMVVGEKAVETGRDTTLEIEFPGAAEVPGGRLALPVHVAWSRQEAGGTTFHSGFEFLEMTEQNRQVIEALVARYKFSRKRPE
ncbi:MAG: PilZ domain-containing protein [Anaerolineales bacterium]|nr:MAG: PilZ domain-containing protein [Anaerolineales bacterium]